MNDLVEHMKRITTAIGSMMPEPLKQPTDGFTLDVLQAEQSAWALANFGTRPAWHPLLGIIEEVGELETALALFMEAEEIGHGRLKQFGVDVAKLQADVEDAVGDAIVYMVDFCSLMNFPNPEQLLAGASSVPESALDFILATRLAHAFLKRAQGIRGTAEHHEYVMQDILRALYASLQKTAEHVAHKTAATIAQETWSRVKQRNWKKDAQNGGEASP